MANLVSSLLTRGTATRSATALSQEIEFVGGRMGNSADYDHSTLSVRVMAKDLGLALDLLADMTLHPAFAKNEIARAEQEITGEIKRRQDEPGAILEDAFRGRLFRNHPYGHPVIGYDSTVRRLTRPQIMAFYQAWYLPNNCYLIAVGDFSTDSLKAGLAARFAGWARQPVKPISIPRDFAAISRPEAIVITRPDMNQAYIALGHRGIRENSPDVFPTRLMNYVVGAGGSTSRIMKAVRGQRGLAYDARSYFDRRLYDGAFIASTQTRTDSATAAINIILAELNRARDSGIDSSELAKARDFFIGNFPLDFEGMSDKAWIMDRIELFGLGLDYLDKFTDNIRKVTLADCLKAARDHIFPQNYLLVAVGNLTKEDLKLLDLHFND
jgi:zinc protease